MRKYIAAVLACLSLCALVLPALADNSAPVAENFEFETYRGVSFGGFLDWLEAFSEKENLECGISVTTDTDTVGEAIKKYMI